MEKTYFVFTCRRYELGECYTPEGEELDDEEKTKILKGHFKEHPEIFSRPKDDNIIEIVDCLMDNKSCEHIVDARVLKGGLILPKDDDSQPFSIQEDMLIVSQAYAYVEITLDSSFNELDEDSQNDVYSDIYYGITLNLKCEGYCWVSTQCPEMYASIAEGDDLEKIHKLLEDDKT